MLGPHQGLPEGRHEQDPPRLEPTRTMGQATPHHAREHTHMRGRAAHSGSTHVHMAYTCPAAGAPMCTRPTQPGASTCPSWVQIPVVLPQREGRERAGHQQLSVLLWPPTVLTHCCGHRPRVLPPPRVLPFLCSRFTGAHRLVPGCTQTPVSLADLCPPQSAGMDGNTHGTGPATTAPNPAPGP